MMIVRRGRVCGFMTTVLSTLDSWTRPLVIGTRAVEIARRLGDLRLRIITTAPSLEQRTTMRGEYEHVVEIAAENLAALPAEWVHEYFGMAVPPSVFGRAWLIMSLAELGRFAEAARYEAEAIQLAEPTQHAHTIGWAQFTASMLHLFKGDWAKARLLVEHWIDTCRGLQTPSLLPWAVASSAWALAQIGDASEALSRVREAEELLERQAARGNLCIIVAGPISALGRACLLLGRLDEARRLGESFDRILSAPAWLRGPCAMRLLGDIATHPDQFDAESAASPLPGSAGTRRAARHAAARRPLPFRPGRTSIAAPAIRSTPGESQPPRQTCTARWTWISGSSRAELTNSGDAGAPGVRETS